VGRVKKSSYCCLLNSTLKTFIKTRWTSVFDMLYSISKNYAVLNDILRKMELETLLSFPLITIQLIEDFFDCIKGYIKLLESSNKPNLQYVCPIVNELLNVVCVEFHDDCLAMKLLKKNLRNMVIEKIIPNIKTIHYIASILNQLTRYNK